LKREISAIFTGHVGEAVAEVLVVLLGQQRGRAQDGHLLAVGHGDEGGAHGDLGLAEADVAADQAVHRLAGFHVLDHGIDGGLLVGRFLEAEAVGEGFQVVLLEIERVALARGALGVQVQQFGGRVMHLLGGLLLGLFPLAGAQRVQLDRFRVGAAVARDDLQLRHRHVELGAVGVFEVEEFGVALAEIHVHQAEVAADAVAFMHHRVADLQFGQVAQPAFEVGAAGIGAAPARAGRGGVELVLGDDGDASRPSPSSSEAAGERADAEHEARLAGEEAGEVGQGSGGEAVFGEVVGQRLAPAGRFGQQQHAAGVPARKARSAASGSSALRSTASGGRGPASPVTSADFIKSNTSCGSALAATKNSSSRRNSSPGGSTGRERSPPSIL
jgi:hypothetical protein